ncbi:hypothetical protein ACT1UG_25465 [Bacillus paramycoides]|uniref:hypothetical protein n=1 Tax=Bacillus paramycoides TaxID=2026194 RepID=UPI004057DEB2
MNKEIQELFDDLNLFARQIANVRLLNSSFDGIFGLTFGVWILAFGVRKYISFATKNKQERRKLKTMFSVISVLSCYAATMLFFI